MRSESSGGRKVLPRMRSEVIIGSIESDGFAFQGVCSPVEAGEVARIACRRGGDLPRGLRKFAQDDRLFTVMLSVSETSPGRAVYRGVDFTFPGRNGLRLSRRVRR